MCVITAVWMSYNLLDNSFLCPKQPSVTFITKNCISIVDFVLHHECVHLCLPLFVCPVYHLLILPDLVYKCKLLNFMGVQAQLSSPFLLITTSRIKLSLYILIM